MTTNTDINELARQLREAAKTSLSAPEFGSSDVAGITRLRLMKPFVDLSRPKNILAILDALEAAQKQNAQDKEIKVRLCEESNNLHDRLMEAQKRIAELEASQPVAPEWISVSDRLPENEDYVLAADSYDKYLNNPPRQQVACFGDWFGDGETTWDDGDGNDLILNQVTHWMPLPAAPVLQEE